MKGKIIKADWTSLSLAEDEAVIVCIKSKDERCCIQFGSLEELKQVIDSKKICTKKWVIGVPLNSCILKRLVLPVSDLAEAAKMVEFELPCLIPLPMEKVVYGCTLLNKQENMLNVLVCIVTLSTINQILKSYKEIGIEPSRATADFLAIQNWFNAINGETSGPLMNIFVDKSRCIILTSIDGNCQRINELVIQDKDFTAFSNEIVGEILSEHKEIYSSNKKNACITLSGSKEYVSEIKHLLEENPNNLVSGEIHIAEAPKAARYGKNKSEYENIDSKYGAVIAFGLCESIANSKLQHSNLLPQQYAKKSQQKALLFNYAITGSLSVVSILLLWLCLVVMNWRIEKQCHEIESQIKPIEDVAGSVDRKRQLIKAVQKQLSNSGRITQIFKELYRYTPPPISISQLKFTSKTNGANIDIKGQADLLSSAFEYSDAMSKAKLLDKIQIINAQQIPRPGGSIVEFKANCVIWSK